MPRLAQLKGQGNLRREDVAADRITIFEEGQTRAGYSTQRPRVISASSHPKSPSKSPRKLSASPRKSLAQSPAYDLDIPEPDLQSPHVKPLRLKGKVCLLSSVSLLLTHVPDLQ